jgi:Na+-transporting NADH:ubiquinone oxidoreductase subunit A
VAAGSPLFHDRKRPWNVAVSPVSGVVSRLDPGPRRSIAALEITPEGEEAVEFDLAGAGTREGLIELMIGSGLWPFVRARPFGKVADPATHPEALFITATEGFDGAPDPDAVIAACRDWFWRGVRALPVLTGGATYLCHRLGPDLPALPGVTARAFADGLAGAHIHELHPVAHGGMVWQIGWQQRVVAVSGPAVTRPGLVAAAPGSRLHHIADGRLADVPLRLLAGSRETGLATPFLAPGMRQVTALAHHGASMRAGRLHRLLRPLVAPFIPNFWDEQASPPGVLPVPLLRALGSGDVEAARRLGVLGLVEENIAGLNAHLGDGENGGLDYRTLLRQTLDELEAMA